MIPRVAHFVFGLREQDEPFHFLQYASLESCRRVLEPETIYFHHKHLPWGPWWERIQRHVTLVEVDYVEEVLSADYLPGRVPAEYRYAHHADFIRLGALLDHGGVYADIDTIFVRPFADELFDAPFVIGREPAVRDERTGELRPSLCNALMMAEPGAAFARTWQAQMADALDGTWSNHSGFLPERLSRSSPEIVRVEPEVSFFPFAPNRAGVSRLLEQRAQLPQGTVSVHLWAHLWWERRRRDFSSAHAGWFIPAFLRRAPTTLADLARPYVPEPDEGRRRAPNRAIADSSSAPVPASRWGYLSLDEHSGYGIAAQRCIAALETSGLEVEWIPFVPGRGWGLAYQPWLPLPVAFEHGKAKSPRVAGSEEATSRNGEGTVPSVLVAHLVPEFLPLVRARAPEAFLVAHTVWDTDRIPNHWIDRLDRADLIVVPSQFSADAIAASSVSTPVEVVPHVAPPVSSRLPAAPATIPDDVFVFYTIGEWTERKAILKTVEAYVRAFTRHDRVLLIIKSSRRDMRFTLDSPLAAGEGTSAWSLARLLASHPDSPAIRLITRDLSNAEIAALHRRGNCYVSLCRSEGFGLGAFDAAAYGNPVVMTGFGGQLDFLGDSPYLVSFDLVPVLDPPGYPSYAPDQRWAEPDLDHAAALLRKVAEHPDEASALARSRAARIRRQYSPESIADAFRAAVDNVSSRRGRPTASPAVTRR
jgi:glycosyltransferase involved in cell wall biosynthesis